jgi:hypothetical protein
MEMRPPNAGFMADKRVRPISSFGHEGRGVPSVSVGMSHGGGWQKALDTTRPF